MRSSKRLLIAVLVLTACSGCFRITYHLDTPSGDVYKNRYWNTFFIADLVPVTESYEYEAMCRSDRLIEVRSYRSAPNTFATVLGLFTAASTVEAVCVREPAKQVSTVKERTISWFRR